MRTTDLFKINRSSKRLNESFQKMFGKKINLETFDLEQLQDARNKLRTQVSQVRGEAGFNETLENDAFTQAQWMLDAINAEISERAEFIADPEQTTVAESDGSESEVMRQVASGKLDAYDVLNSPKTDMERAASEVMQRMYDDIVIDHRLNPDDDFEEILDLVVDRIADDYGTDEEEYGDWGEPMDSDPRQEQFSVEAEANVEQTVVFSGNGEWMDQHLEKVLDHFNISLLDQNYDEDSGVIEVTVSGNTEDIQKAGQTLEGLPQSEGNYGGYVEPTSDFEESAPPTAKGERMVKHIKKGYTDDGKLTKKEKSIAYATAWKQHNKDKNESVNTGDNMTKLREGEIQQAQSIVTAKTMVDRVGRWIEELSGMENDTLLQLGDQIRDEMSQEQAKSFISAVAPAIQAALENLKTTRETLATGVRLLTGEEQGAEMLGAEPTDMPPEDELGAVEPDAMNPEEEPDLFAEPEDEFGAAEPAAGGMGDAGREKRESIDRGNSLLKVLAG